MPGQISNKFEKPDRQDRMKIKFHSCNSGHNVQIYGRHSRLDGFWVPGLWGRECILVSPSV